MVPASKGEEYAIEKVQPGPGIDGNDRFGSAYVSPTGDYAPPYDIECSVGVLTEEADAALGGFVGFEYMVSDLIGLDATLLFSNHEIDWTEVGTYLDEPYSRNGVWGDISIMPLFIGANFHVKQTDALDFYVGPFLAYVMYGDIDADEDPHYFEPYTLDVNPVILQVGVGKKW